MKILLFSEAINVNISLLKGQSGTSVRQTRQPNFKTKTQARKALWVTLAL